jgi:hypothetical protein
MGGGEIEGRPPPPSRPLGTSPSSTPLAWQLGGPKLEVGEIGSTVLEVGKRSASGPASHRAPSAAPDPAGGGGDGRCRRWGRG